MANCCDYKSCEGLVTIGFMKNLVNATPVSGCVTISAGTTADTCCDETTNGDNYVPTYHELSANTFTTARRSTPTNPSNDKNGFTYTVPTFSGSDCCEVSIDKEALMVSGITFGYTVAEDNVLVITANPTTCDTTYGWRETKVYSRHTLGLTCSGETSTETTATTSYTYTDSLTRQVTDVSDRSWNVSFVPNTITGKTVASCNSVSSSTTVELNGYSFGITINCPSSSVPCEATSYNMITVDQLQCAEDLSLVISSDDIPNFQEITWDGSQGTGASTVIPVEIPRNSNNKSSGTITITPTVWDVPKQPIECVISRTICSTNWDATINCKNCSVFNSTVEWNHSSDPIIIQHDNQ